MPFSLNLFARKNLFNLSAKTKKLFPSNFGSSKSSSKTMSPFNDNLNLPLLKDVKCYSKGFNLSDGTTMTLEVQQQKESIFSIKLDGTDKTLKDIKFMNVDPKISICEINDIEFECCISSKSKSDKIPSKEEEFEDEDFILEFQIHFKLQRIKFGLSQNLLFDFGHFQKLTSAEYVQFYIRKHPQLPKLYCSFRKIYNQSRYRILFHIGSSGKRILEKPRMTRIIKRDQIFEILFTEPKSDLEIEYMKILKESIQSIGEGKLKFKAEVIHF